MDKAEYFSLPAIVGTTKQSSKMRNKLDIQHYTFHMDRMKNVKPVIDNKAPKTYLHLRTRKIQMEQERLHKLEMENRVLVSRIALIKNEKGGLDNWNSTKPKPSLNSEQRNREQAKIYLENQATLKKIKATKSEYDHERCLRDYRVTREYVARLQKNPRESTPLTKLPPIKKLR